MQFCTDGQIRTNLATSLGGHWSWQDSTLSYLKGGAVGRFFNVAISVHEL